MYGHEDGSKAYWAMRVWGVMEGRDSICDTRWSGLSARVRMENMSVSRTKEGLGGN